MAITATPKTARTMQHLSLPMFVTTAVAIILAAFVVGGHCADAGTRGGMPSPFSRAVDARDRGAGSKAPLDGKDSEPLPPSYPTKEFAAQDSSPVLLISNLKQYESVMHVTAAAMLQEKDSSGGQVYHKIPYFNLGNPNVTGLRLPEGVHAYAIPDFHLNHTSALEFRFWTPCDQEAEGMFDLTVMPCFYSPFEPEEGKVHKPYFSHGERGTMYLPYHVPEDLKHPSYAAYLEAQAKREAGTCTEAGECDVEEPAVVRINTKVDCWFPPHKSIEAHATPVNLIGHDHRIGIKEVVYQRVAATNPPSGATEVFYDTRIKEYPAKPVDPLPESAQEAVAAGTAPEIVDGAVVVGGVRYCRSVLQVFAADPNDDSKLTSDPVGWTIASPMQQQQQQQQQQHRQTPITHQ